MGKKKENGIGIMIKGIPEFKGILYEHAGTAGQALEKYFVKYLSGRTKEQLKKEYGNWDVWQNEDKEGFIEEMAEVVAEAYSLAVVDKNHNTLYTGRYVKEDWE